MQKQVIKNRKGQSVAVLVEQVTSQRGLAFVMHGLGGFKEQHHLRAAADVFTQAGITVVRFDTTNTYGESDGKPEDATMAGFLEDLEDTVHWAASQPFYQEPFFMVGHSMGGQCVGTFAERQPVKVRGLVFLATSVSGKLGAQKYSADELEAWERTGWRESKSTTRAGLVHRVKWANMADRLKYDLLLEIHSLTMPALVVIGDQDEFIPLAHERALFDALPGKKEWNVIRGAGHNFGEVGQLDELRNIIGRWVNSSLALKPLGE